MEAYHDEEWGVPSADDRHIFEHFCLECFQAGLSWRIILGRREGLAQAFHGFEPARVARFDRRAIARLLADPRIIRNRLKVEAVVNNARRLPELARDFGSLAAYLWEFEPPRRRRAATREGMPARSEESAALGRDLKRRGWRFVGPTGMYALMQAVGLVNDHVAGCPRRAAVEAARRELRRPATR
jgi:DNA-3-methyladenine glycosylase I